MQGTTSQSVQGTTSQSVQGTTSESVQGTTSQSMQGLQVSLCKELQVSPCKGLQVSLCKELQVSLCKELQVSLCKELQVSLCKELQVSLARDYKLVCVRDYKSVCVRDYKSVCVRDYKSVCARDYKSVCSRDFVQRTTSQSVLEHIGSIACIHFLAFTSLPYLNQQVTFCFEAQQFCFVLVHVSDTFPVLWNYCSRSNPSMHIFASLLSAYISSIDTPNNARMCKPDIKHVYTTLKMLWKFFHYSPKRAESLTEIKKV